MATCHILRGLPFFSWLEVSGLLPWQRSGPVAWHCPGVVILPVDDLQLLSLAPQLMVFFVAATVLYITAFITCASAVDLTSLKGSRPYNQRSAASVSMLPRLRLQPSAGDPPAQACVLTGARMLSVTLFSLGTWTLGIIVDLCWATLVLLSPVTWGGC